MPPTRSPTSKLNSDIWQPLPQFQEWGGRCHFVFVPGPLGQRVQWLISRKGWHQWASVAPWRLPPGFFRKYNNTLECWCLMKWFNYKGKWKSRFAWEIEISSIKTESNRCFHRKPDIILWSLRSFWVGRFDLNQSLQIDSWRKSFLYQCKNSTQNWLFPRSRLGQMTYLKLKPHPSRHLLHAPFHLFYIFYLNNGKPLNFHIVPFIFP